MRRKVVFALYLAAVLVAPAAGSSDTSPPAPSADPTVPALEEPAAPEPTETNTAIEEAPEPPSSQTAVGDAPAEPPPSPTAVGEATAGGPSGELRASDAPAPPSSKRRRSARPIARAAAGSIVIRDFEFSPGTVTVAVGETVTWTNSGPSEHSATAASFDTGILPKGQGASHTFGNAGTFSYACRVHPSMQGTVRVVGSGSGTPGGSPSADPDGANPGEDAGTGGVAAQDGGETLPDTGLDLLPASVGIALVAVGVALARATRRSPG